MAANPHKRKISLADLTATFRNAGPMIPPQHPSQLNNPSASAAQQPTPTQLQAQRIDDMRRQEAARRASRKPTDRELPEDLADGVIIGDGVQRYKKLRDVERKLDSVMMRKRLDVGENLQRRYERREGVVRVWVSNTCDGQPWQVIEEGRADAEQVFELGDGGNATWRVKIEGRLLDDPSEEEETDEGATDRKKPKFSSFFRAITVDFAPANNPSLHPDGYSAIEWRKPQPTLNHPISATDSAVNFDTLEFERKGDENENVNVTINLVRDEKNERFRLSPALAEILDTEEEDRAGAVQGVWEYCRAKGLQEDTERRSIICDDALRRLFNQDQIYFPYVPDLLVPHLLPLPPIQLHYTIRVDKDYIKSGSPPTVYDLRVPLPNPTMQALTKFHTSRSHLSTLKEIVKADEDLAVLVQKINNTNGKRKFYDSLSRDPGAFIQRWVKSQRRDLEVIAAEAGRNGEVEGEEWRRSGEGSVWQSGGRAVEEAVGGMLARKGGH
ncbi:SWI/SNF and RSC complex subunit Ssr3 [Elasticomyces elasticus]|nr:SWI/SNF and RSC complex subunit Ssr3 [Elasticomyces elasticus]KAK3661965.1 SWI/SNF and RSC complex subunit Ssr3 [Elasticomyces elasticus]KAK4933132.1 SWI/SNF and RSC complex subunit Ssr3 [Elasticomyces elasticus]KAK5755875.1 SWI/SNF and RSC complex subunit Ssr3 [Elasticomyces elasticus]